jgi:hypothetical protein
LIIHREPAVFWNMLLHKEDYDQKEPYTAVSILPFLRAAPANNRKLLMKRTTAKDDEKMGFLLPPASNSFLNEDKRKEVSNRRARIGAIHCMIELGRRSPPDQDISFEVADYLIGTDVERDIKEALSFVNDGRQYKQATQVLKGGPFCECCGKGDDDTKLMVCSRCHSVEYCSKECQKNDYAKHKKICKKLKADVDFPEGEVTYDDNVFATGPYLMQAKAQAMHGRS